MTRPKRYKFTKKKRSNQALVSLICSGASLAGFFITLGFAVKAKGTAPAMIGIIAIVLSVAALAALIFAIAAVRNEDTFPLLPRIALIVSILALAVWVGIYILGFYFWQ